MGCPGGGWSIERRAFLRMPAGAALYVMAGLQESAGEARSGSLDFDGFVKRVGESALALIADSGRGEEAYLFEVAALAARLEGVPEAKLGEPFRGLIRTGLNYRGSGIVVVQWSMAPGLTYPAHNHPNYNGITLGLEGECRIRNFDPVAVPPEMGSAEGFLVRETQNHALTPGRVVSIMSTTHDNIHQLETADQAVRRIDVMTLVGKHVGFSYVELDEDSRTEEGMYEARWGERMAR